MEMRPMDFIQSPVWVEFGFGILFLMMGLLIRVFPRLSGTVSLVGSLVLVILARLLAAPYSLTISALLLLVSCVSHPFAGKAFSATTGALGGLPFSRWIGPAFLVMAGLFLVLAPAHILEAVEQRDALALELSVDSDPGLESSAASTGITDKGNPIHLYNGATVRDRDDESWLHAHDYDFQLVKLDVDEGDCNCHGHVFAGGRYWVLGRDIPAILNDNGYLETDSPIQGDLVIHRNSEGGVIHTGIVRASGPGFPVLVESKWGQLGVYIHPVDRTPYSGPRNYYRAARGSHLIRIEERRTG